MSEGELSHTPTVGNHFESPSRWLFNPRKLASYLVDRQRRGVGAGLNNLGNTCYMNSVLQCLMYSPPVSNFALDGLDEEMRFRAGNFAALPALCDLVRATAARDTSLAPRAFASNVTHIVRHFRLGRQEDAHEFLRFLLQGMQAECVAAATGSVTAKDGETAFIHQTFGGYLKSTVKCMRCRYESNTFDPFLDLSLDVASSVTASLQSFTRSEKLGLDIGYKCSKCKVPVAASKGFSILIPPNVLTVHLKRFNFRGGKVDRMVDFAEELDISAFLSRPGQRVVYRLTSVLVHAGASSNSGHYFAFVRVGRDWFRMDDASVRPVPFATVLQQRAYLLFYTKDPAQSVDLVRPVRRNSRALRTPGGGPKPRTPSSLSPARAGGKHDEDWHSPVTQPLARLYSQVTTLFGGETGEEEDGAAYVGADGSPPQPASARRNYSARRSVRRSSWGDESDDGSDVEAARPRSSSGKSVRWAASVDHSAHQADRKRRRRRLCRVFGWTTLFLFIVALVLVLVFVVPDE